MELAGGIGEGMENGNMRVLDGPDRGGIERESNEKDILIEGAIMELRKNLMSGKLPGIHKNNSN